MNVYDYISDFYLRYKRRKCVIGYSFCGRSIYALHVGNACGKQFIAVYAVHAREWITSYLALRHIKGKVNLGGWVIPLLNPDGAIISQSSAPLWKANGRGVDINCNFNADWGCGKLNTLKRGAENCIGDAPESEPETAAIVNFTQRVNPFATVSFHTKGGEVYWEYGGFGDEGGARAIAESCGYQPKQITGSCGGYKDWCIQKLKIPAFTVECGNDNLLHPITRLKDIKECNNALKDFTKYYERKIYEERFKMRPKSP